ncbi:MAG: hypothetical protein ABI565_07775 [Vicinamibacteria bacterium]
MFQILVLGFLCTRPGIALARECRSTAPGASDVRAVATGIVAADNERNIEQVLSYYAPDAILMPPGESRNRARADPTEV